MSRQHLFSVSLAAALALASQAAGAAPVIISNPVRAPLPADTGNGLCIASAVSATPEIDFPTQAPLYNGALNAFIEAHEKDRVTSVVRTVLDLSNNNILGGLKVSFGDFTNPMPGLCQEGGCGFFINDTTTSFASRIRGFLNVTEDLVNKPVHIGLYADDAVSVALFDKNGTSYNVVLRPPQLGKATWRTTNQVTFQQPGFYPIEILYAQIANDAALEMSLFVDEKNEFTDFELPVNQAGTANLQKAGFSLFTPGYFFQTLSGAPAYPDPATCDQCDRQFANKQATAAAMRAFTATRRPSAPPATRTSSAALAARPAAARRGSASTPTAPSSAASAATTPTAARTERRGPPLRRGEARLPGVQRGQGLPARQGLRGARLRRLRDGQPVRGQLVQLLPGGQQR